MAEKLRGYFSGIAAGTFPGLFLLGVVSNTSMTLVWATVMITATIVWATFKIGDRL